MLSRINRLMQHRTLLAIGLLIVATALALLLGRWLAVIQAPLTRHAVGQNLLAVGEPDRAADAAHVFEEPIWKGVALYRAGRYHRAVGEFVTDDSVTGLYNMGNAYAHLGLYEGAIAAYETVLQHLPTHEDAFFNLDLVRAAAERERELEAESRRTENAGHWEDGLIEDPSTREGETAPENQDAGGNDSETSDATDQNQSDEDAAGSTETSAAEPQTAGTGASGSEREGEQAEAATFSLTTGEERETGALSPKPNGLGDMPVLGGRVDRALEEAMADEILLRRIEDDPALVLKARLAMALRKQKARR